MADSYLTVYKGGFGEIIEKKSRFIATVRPVETVEAATGFILEMKKKYWDASHNCSAFILGEDSMLTRCSDDGEPSGTAGKPMLEVLLGEKLTNIAVVVTRYFGGTLLGTGGLVRAYGQAVKQGLYACEMIEKTKGILLNIQTDYNDSGKVQYLLASKKMSVFDVQYGENVCTKIAVPLSQIEVLEKELIESTSGRVRMENENEILFAVADGKIEIFR